MKYRNKKAIATLIVTTLIFTCGATGVQAAPAADLPGSGTGKYTDSSRAGCIGTEYGGRSD